MNERHLLVNSITLLCRASQLQHASNDFSSLVRETVSDIKLPEFTVGVSGEAKVIDALKKTALNLCSNPDIANYVKTTLLQDLKIDTADDVDLFDALERGIAPPLSEEEVKQVCISISNNLQRYRKDKDVSEIISKAAYKIKFQKDDIPDMRAFVNELATQLEPYQGSMDDKADPAIVSHVDLGNIEQIKKVCQNIKEMNLEDGILRTGWQGLNRMTRGGFRRGEQIVIGALQHNYKTGFSLSVFKQIALYNTPYMIDKAKKPLLIRISFEDDLALNIEFLYRSLKENETGEPLPDKIDISIDEMSLYIHEKMGVNGYHIDMLRVDPTQWTYRDVINYCLKKEAEGYEIHVLMLDYLKMLPTTGCTQGATGQDVRDMFRRVRNFTNPRRITCITPHQLSTDAKMLIRDGRTDFVRELPGKGFYDGCKTIDNEVDMEIFIHIEKMNGRAYLTLQRGKHRINGVTPIEYQYAILPFQLKGCILDDINGADSTRTKLGGGPVGSKEENPFWDMEAA